MCVDYNGYVVIKSHLVFVSKGIMISMCACKYICWYFVMPLCIKKRYFKRQLVITEALNQKSVFLFCSLSWRNLEHCYWWQCAFLDLMPRWHTHYFKCVWNAFYFNTELIFAYMSDMLLKNITITIHGCTD